MRVAFTREALEDLSDIAEHIATDAPRRALSFIQELRQSARGVGKTPHAYPFDPRYETLAVRRRVHGNYLILYRIVGDRVDILRIVHGARDHVPLTDSRK